MILPIAIIDENNRGGRITTSLRTTVEDVIRFFYTLGISEWIITYEGKIKPILQHDGDKYTVIFGPLYFRDNKKFIKPAVTVCSKHVATCS